MEVYDLVKVTTPHDENGKEFIGALGVITEVHKGTEYPYELVFVGKKLNKKSQKLGGLLWKENQLEAI